MDYILLNKNKHMANIQLDGDNLGIENISIPFLSIDINSWVVNRFKPSTRANLTKALKLAEITSIEEYISINYGISMTDTFWIKTCESKLTWEEISPYRNELCTAISTLAVSGIYNGENLKSPSPDYTVDGSADKCWVRENGEIYLYKTFGERFSGLAGLRPYCEYYASQVANALISDKGHFIPYGIKVSTTREGYLKGYCYCPIFTSETYGYIPYDCSPYKGMILSELDSNLHNRRDREIIREMLLLDSLILNYDRHMGNYGFMVNNDTYKIVGMAPIFDQDCSLGNFVPIQYKSYADAYEMILEKEPRTEMGDYIEQARWSLTKDLKQRLIDMHPFHFVRLKTNVDLDDRRIAFMEYIVNNQIKRILQG